MSESPSAELQAMVQAQKELYEMLGISLDELRGKQPRMRRSMSAIGLSARAKEPMQPRPNSDVLTPPPTQREWPL